MATKAFKPAIYRCKFGCRRPCKTPGGLTKHYETCKFNPHNRYRFPQPPRTPSPATEAGTPFETPPPHQGGPEVPPTPSHSTPRRGTWQANGRSGIYVEKHPYLDGHPCDADGFDLPPGAPPPPPESSDEDDYFPFSDQAEFQLADFLFTRVEMSAANTTTLMELWAANQAAKNEDVDPPFANAADLHSKIDSIPLGDIPWEGFKVKYNGEVPPNAPTWMTKEFEVWFRNPLHVVESQIGNPDFGKETDWAPKRVYRAANKKRIYTDLMSGIWAWEKANELAKDPDTHGAMLVPIILGSDKTTVSVATGQNEYYPLYISPGNVQNHVRRAHRNAVSLLGFLAIPKTEQHEQDSAEFRQFRRQLFHSSLAQILQPLKPYMEKPRVTRCGDGHFRRVIFELGPYIADYPEQVLLACVVSGWCPKCTAHSSKLDHDFEDAVPRSPEHTESLWRSVGGDAKRLWEGYGIIADIEPFTSLLSPRANIHELLSPDLLHQIIKGTFKDHLVTWVVDFLKSQPDGDRLVAEMDRRIAAAPPFAGLRRFPEGRGFKQWTGDDSKALMKVFLPAIAGLVPAGILRALSAFLEFCYLVRRSQIDEDVLDQIDEAVTRFNNERHIFVELGIREHFLLPRQHSLVHYRNMIQLFSAPNGLCSSITESKHIKAVKKPYRRSSRNNPLGQMLLTNQRIDKLAAARVDFEFRGMLDPVHGLSLPGRKPLPISSGNDPGQVEDDVDAEDVEGVTSEGDVRFPKRPVGGYPKTLLAISLALDLPQLEEHIRRFLYDQQNPDSEVFGMDVDIDSCPQVQPTLRIRIYHSAAAVYHAPSDLSGIGGMHREYIRATPSWKRGEARHDCVFVEREPDEEGFRALGTAQVQMFFSFYHDDKQYCCALVRWFEVIGNSPCPDTGMWLVQPDIDARSRRRIVSVIHIDSILRAAHLIGNCGRSFIPYHVTPSKALRAFKSYYVNKYADHHAHEIAF